MSYGEVHILCFCLDELYINHISYMYINTSYYTPQPILLLSIGSHTMRYIQRLKISQHKMFWLKEKQNGQDKQVINYLENSFLWNKNKRTQTPKSDQHVNKMDPNMSPLFALWSIYLQQRYLGHKPKHLIILFKVSIGYKNDWSWSTIVVNTQWVTYTGTCSTWLIQLDTFLWNFYEIGLHELHFRHRLGVRQEYFNCLGLLKHTTLYSLDNFSE